MKGHQPSRAAQFERYKQRGRCSLSKGCGRCGKCHGEPLDPDVRTRAYRYSAVRRPIGSFRGVVLFSKRSTDWVGQAVEQSHMVQGAYLARERGRAVVFTMHVIEG